MIVCVFVFYGDITFVVANLPRRMSKKSTSAILKKAKRW